MYIRK